MFRVLIPVRSALLSGTALMGLLSFGFTGQAMAACSPNVPADGATVTCTGADTTGVSGNGNSVSLTMDVGSSIATTGVSAIDLGTGATVNILNNNAISSNVATITADGGSTINMNAGSSVTSTTSPAISYTGAAGQVFTVGVGGTISGGAGVAVDMGQSLARVFVTSGTNVTGTVAAGAGVGDRVELTGSSNYSFNVNELGTKYTGFEEFRKSGTGTATLTGTGSQSWQVNAGGGTLEGDTTSLSGNIINNSVVRFNQNTNGTYAGVMSGTGALQKSGTGTVILSGANTYSGGTTITAGALNISSNSNLGTGGLTLNGGTLQYGAAISSGGFNVAVGAGGGTIDTNGFTSITNGAFSGSGNLTKTGAGTYSILGAGTYNGQLTVDAGVVSTRTNAMSGNVVLNGGGNPNNAVFGFNQDFAGTYAGQISGNGIVQMYSGTGTGLVTLSGNNTYTGYTRIYSGTLNVSSNNNLGDASADIRLQGTGTLQYGASFDTARNVQLNVTGGSIDTNGYNSTMSGVFSGSGSLIKTGLGVLTLSGANTNTGGTTINAGILEASSNSNLGNSSGALTFNGGTFRYGAGFTMARNVVLGASGGTVDLNGFYNGPTPAISGAITGSGSLTVTGFGKLDVTGTNTYTGGTIVNAGAQFSGAAGTSIQGNILNNGDVFLATGTYAGNMSGIGRIINFGSVVSLTGNNTFSGGINTTAGTIVASADTNLGDSSGGLTLSSGSLLQYGASFNTGRTFSLGAGGGGVNTNGFNTTLSGVVSGTGGFIKNGNGTAILSGTNTYTGGTTVNAGTVSISSENNLGAVSGDLTLNGGSLSFGTGFTSARNVIVGSSGGSINVNNGSNATISGNLSGSGLLTKNGSMKLTLLGTNTNTGGYNITNGQLEGTTSSLRGNIAVSTNAVGSGLQFTQNFDGTFSDVISGVGKVIKYGTGNVTLSGINTYSGGTEISAGTVTVSSDSNLGDASGGLSFNGNGATLRASASISTGRSIVLNTGGGTIHTNGNTVTLTGAISGTGALTKAGAGTLTLTGTNTYSGGTTISAGTLAITNNANLGNNSGALTLDGGTLQTTAGAMSRSVVIGTSGGTIDTNGVNNIFTGAVSGSGNLTKAGAGLLSLASTSGYGGQLTISAGSASIRTDSHIANVVNNASLDFTQSFNGAYSGVISGTGMVNVGLAGTNTGIVTLSGNNTYSGDTRIFSGTLNVSSDSNLGNTSGAIRLAGGTLQYGAGFTSARNVQFLSGPGYIDTNGFNSELSGVVSGSNSLIKLGTGTLTLTGTNTYSGGTVVSGVNSAVRISSDSNLGSGDVTLSNGGELARYSGTVNVARNIILSSGNGILVASNGALSASGIISGAGRLVARGGTGTLTLTGNNTYTGGTQLLTGNLSVSSDANLGDVSGGLTFSGGTLVYGAGFTSGRTVALSSNATINTNGFNSTLSGVVSGAGGLTKSGTGTLTLTGANTYTGDTAVSAGTLQVSASNLHGNTSIASGAALAFDESGFGVYSGIISGAGKVQKFGGGALILGGANTYTGGTELHDGALLWFEDGQLGAASGTLGLYGGAIQYGDSFSSSRAVTLSSSSTINTDGYDTTLSGVVSGTGSFTKIGGGTLTLSNANTYSGGTTVSGGTVAIGTNTSLGTGALTLNGGALQFDAALNYAGATAIGAGGGSIDTNGFNSTMSGVISGSSLLTKTGTGTLTLGGTNTNTGGIRVTGGALAISNNNNLGASGTLTLDGGTLETLAAMTISRSISLGAGNGGVNTGAFNSIISSVISGSGGLIKTGTGILTLNGANTYAGGTLISAGRVSGSTTSLQGNIVNNGNLTFNQSTNGTYSGVISGSGVLQKNGTGTVTLTGANTYTGGTGIYNGGALIVSADNNLGAANGNITFGDGSKLIYAAGFTSARNVILGAGGGIFDTNGFDSTITGNVSGTGSLTKAGAGTLTLGGTNSYTGTTIVTGGRLLSTTEVLQGNVTNNADVVFDQNVNGTYGANMSGTGGFVKDGSGTVVLTGTNTYSGGTTVNDGRLSVNGSIAGTTTVGSSGALGGTGTTGTIVNNGRLAPGNSIGTLNVTGDVTFNNGSVYEVEVDDAGNSDRIIATGNLILNGGVVDVRAAAGTYGASTNYTILQGSGRTGVFSNVTSDLAFLTPTLGYTANAVQLTLARNGTSFNIVSSDDVQRGVANAVEGLGTGNALYDAFVGLNLKQASQALDTLSGEHNAGLTTATVQSSTMIRNIVTRRQQSMARIHDVQDHNLMALRPVNDHMDAMPDVDRQKLSVLEPAAGDVLGNIPEGKGMWTEVFGGYGHSDRKGTAPSQNRDAGGVLAGMDIPLSNKSSMGVFGGWEKGEVYTDSQFANSDIESWHAGTYGSYFPSEAWRVSGGLMGTYHSIDTTRHIAFSNFRDTAKGDTTGYTVSGYAEAGYTIDLNTIALEPFAGVSVTHSSIDGYREKEGGAARLDVDSVSQTTPAHTIGVRAGKSVTIADDVDINVRGHVGWMHNYGDLSANSTMRFVDGSTPFDIRGAQTARDAAIFGAGVDAAIGGDAKAYVDYNGSMATDERNHGVTLGVKIKF